MNRVMRYFKLIVRANMNRRCHASRWRFHQTDLSGRLKRARHLNAKIAVHGRRAVLWMMVEENVVSVGPQSRRLPQKFPNLIERGTPCLRHFADPHLPPHRRQLPRRNSFDLNRIRHACSIANRRDSNVTIPPFENREGWGSLALLMMCRISLH